jgi:adenosine/AMP kinase
MNKFKAPLIILASGLVALTSCGNNKPSSAIETGASVSSSATSAQVSSSASSTEASSAAASSSLASSSSAEPTVTIGYKTITPIGAPAVAFAPFIKDSGDKVSIAAPTSVVAAFSSDEYQAIVFDLVKGCNFISKQSKKYRLASVLTAGNSYVIATGNDTDGKIDATDACVSFGTNSIFTGIFKKVYGVTTVSEVSDVSTAYNVATTGLLEGNKVNYVILSEPLATKALKASSSCTLFANLTTAWVDYSKAQGLNGGKGFDGFPQAGLFISQALDEDTSKQEEIKNYVSQIAANAKDLATNDGQEVLKAIKRDTDNNLYNPASSFGMDYATLKSVVDHNENLNHVTNALAFNYDQAYDVNGFLSEAALTGFSSFPSSVFSSYYNANHVVA